MMTSKSKFLVLALLAMMFVAGAVQAADKKDAAAQAAQQKDASLATRIFHTLDDNKDSVVTMAEVTAHHKEFYNAIDTDKNGGVTSAEADKAGKQAADFQELNDDKNQSVSFEESLQVEQERFAAADADKDNRVSFTEFMDHAEAVSP